MESDPHSQAVNEDFVDRLVYTHPAEGTWIVTMWSWRQFRADEMVHPVCRCLSRSLHRDLSKLLTKLY